MKQYLIDELRLKDYKKIKAYLDKTFGNSGIGGVYWIKLPENILSDTQKNHDQCRPFYFAVSLSENKIAAEFLIRSKNLIHCSCISYSNRKQLDWIMSFVDEIIKKLQIIV